MCRVEHAAPGRRRRLLAEAKEREGRLGDDGGGDRQRRLHQQRRQDVGQDVRERDPPGRVAECARGLDIVLGLHDQHLATGQADEDRGCRDADCDHGVAEARPEERGERDRQDQERAGQHRIRDPADQRIDETAAIAGEQAERHADAERDRDRDQAREQGGARAIDDTAEDVAAKLVSAEPVRGGRRLAHEAPARRDGIVGHDERREDRKQDERRDHDESEYGGLALEQPPPCAARRAVQLGRVRAGGGGGQGGICHGASPAVAD
ncbi:hypothetical protein TSA1_31300 [Bradyrhizobium nitroreducens]|uniref:Uncharacterized protein n=1 Tax=Bradyrhizobium nitroreducens TaxID=709803 RepID=A0A2M6UJK2_9BRAD|nr:hypothetical protein TSA1_31300 [Bradyrhizobium nitroreducens]